MTQATIKKASKIKGEISFSGDKSITHRAIMIGSITSGVTKVSNFSLSADCAVTMEAFKRMGIDIEQNKKELVIHGKGLKGLSAPSEDLYMADSGTSMRLLSGILAGQNFKVTLKGDASLSKRPMKRVTDPLRMMGAEITGPEDANFAPLTIKGGHLKGINYETKISSAQIKSAILFAGLYADGITTLKEEEKSRDHTERMLKLFGAKIRQKNLEVSLEGKAELSPQSIIIPGDISSAAFFIVAATLLENSGLTIKSVSLNPTRTGLIDVIKKMGGNIKEIKSEEYFEPTGDIIVNHSKLKGILIEKKDIPRLIDELPIIMIAASFAEGKTLIKSAGELRVKETDRIHSMMTNLSSIGADISIAQDDIIIHGKERLLGGKVSSFGDHRTAMALAVAGLLTEKELIIDDIDCVKKSFPDFFEKLNSITQY